MTIMHTEHFDTFIVELELGMAYDYSETRINLITHCPEKAEEQMNKLAEENHSGGWDYVLIKVVGCKADTPNSNLLLDYKHVALQPSHFDMLIDMMDADPLHGSDIAAGGINLTDDANSQENISYTQLYDDEMSLSHKAVLKSNFRSVDISMLN